MDLLCVSGSTSDGGMGDAGRRAGEDGGRGDDGPESAASVGIVVLDDIMSERVKCQR